MNRQSQQEQDKNKPSSDSPPKGESLCLVVGFIKKPHGVHGEVLLKVMTDFPERLKKGKKVYLGEDHYPVTIAEVRSHHQGLLLKFDGLDTVEAVDALRSAAIYVKSDELPALPEGEFYFHQLIGLHVFGKDGVELGVLTEILETGANDVYLVESPEGKEILFPAIDSVIQEINIDEKKIVIDLPEWY